MARRASDEDAYRTDGSTRAGVRRPLRRGQACGWWTTNRAKLTASPADYWVFVVPDRIVEALEKVERAEGETREAVQMLEISLEHR